MQIHRDINALPAFKNAVLTIGSFDGCHIGHQKILENVKLLAKGIAGESVIISFHPHPRQIIYPKDDSLQLIQSLKEKIKSVQLMDIDHLAIVPFTPEFSQISPKQYVEDFLLKRFNPHTVVVGYDHKFGLNRAGDIKLLKQYENEGLFKIVEIPKQVVNEIAVSSSKIRTALIEGDVNVANQFLGKPYSLSGIVVHGEKIGKSIGYPTANLKLEMKNKLIPAEGIYAVLVELEDSLHQAMMYIGKKPTIHADRELAIEVHLLDFNSNVYGKFLQVQVIDFVREDMQFDDLIALRRQIEDDEAKSREILKHYTAMHDMVDHMVAIVILNYNGREYLESFLPLLTDSTKYDAQIYIIDNASTDTSLQYVEEWHPEVKIIRLTENHGFSGGYSLGLRQIRAKYYVILNSDVKVDDHWLDPLIEQLENHDDIACVQPKIKSLENPKMFEYAGSAGGLMDALNYPLCRGRIFDHLEEDLGQYDEEAEIFWASGAAMVIRAELFHKFGGFDPDFFAHQEEIDLCWKLKNAGYKIVFNPLSTIYHLGGGTLAYESPHKVYLNFRNNHFCFIKNEPGLQLLWKAPLRWILDMLAVGFYLSKIKPLHAYAIIRAYGYIIRHFRQMIRKRRLANKCVEKYRMSPKNMSGRISKSIVWQYYILRKKSFQKIVS